MEQHLSLSGKLLLVVTEGKEAAELALKLLQRREGTRVTSTHFSLASASPMAKPDINREVRSNLSQGGTVNICNSSTVH